MDIAPDLVTAQLTKEVASVRVAPDPPSDFETFWRTVRVELARWPANVELTPDDAPRHGQEGLRRFIWRANSLGGRRIAGPVIFPAAGGAKPAPIWVYSHGYGSVNSGAAWRPDLARLGFVALGLDARGYHRSRRPGDPGVPGWATHGIERRESYILRGAVADLLRAVEVA
ncbi:MAG TPA: acetylxylan esterase, partial [Limnochordia bacterium]|nr:acetylxylan esterase [Limnochordia bacterium]